MSETKHTPGPWSVWTPRGPGYLFPRYHILGPAPADERELAPTVAEIPMSTENSEGNARLIAAAPELLDAARYSVEVLDLIQTDDDAIGEAAALLREAIRKATGGDDA